MGYLDICKLQSITSLREKLEFIKERKEDQWFTGFLYYALNPLITYNISDKTMTEVLRMDVPDKIKPCMFFDDILDCCDYLSRLRGIDGATLRQVHVFLMYHCNEEERDLYSKLLSKNLRLGLTAKSVNKVIDNLIPEWEVQQAYPIDKYPVKPGTEFWLTQKLNGFRATFYRGRLMARSGFSYSGLDHITDWLQWAEQSGMVLDGELTLKDKGDMSDNEAFRVAAGILNSDSEHKTEICYTIFDAIPVEDFERQASVMKYKNRRHMMDTYVSDKLTGCESISVLPVLYHGKDLSKVDTLLDRMVREDKEGLVMNLDVPYKRMRHRGILKIKKFYTMDLPIVGWEEGSGRLSGKLGSIVVQYMDNQVKVGTGIPDLERIKMWNSRDEIIGKLCEVKYKEISCDKNTGKKSLQFPVFVCIRDDKSEVSYG